VTCRSLRVPRQAPLSTMKKAGVTALVASAALPWSAQAAAPAPAPTPAEKVVKLLQAMETSLQADITAEQEVYDKYACWCEATTTKKADGITDARTAMRTLGLDVLKQRGIAMARTVDISQTREDIKASEEAQAELTSIRQKENAEYMADSAEMRECNRAVETCVKILNAEGGGSFLQHSTSAAYALKVSNALSAVADAVSTAPERAIVNLEALKGPSRLSMLRKFAKEAGRQHGPYVSQSSSIVGVLTDMYDTFASELQSLVSTEADQNTAYEDLLATKQQTLITLQEHLQKAEMAKAEAEVMMAEATQAFDDTSGALKADVTLFDTIKEACTDKAEEFKTMGQFHKDELAAFGEAIAILDDPAAKTLFGTVHKRALLQGQHAASLLQVESLIEAGAVPTRKAFLALRGVARQARGGRGLQLARLASKVQTATAGHFAEIIDSIKTMVEQLRQEGKADVEKRDECKDDYQEVEAKVADLKWQKNTTETKVTALGEEIIELQADETDVLAEITATNGTITDLEANRTTDNGAFITETDEDKEAIKLLKQAKEVLLEFYKNKSVDLEGASLLQQPDNSSNPPPSEFAGKGGNKGKSKGVIELLSGIQESLKRELEAARKEEEVAQLLFEKELKATKELVQELEKRKVRLGVTIAERQGDKLKEEGEVTTIDGKITVEEGHKTSIEPDCDKLFEHFEDRADKRTAEVEGLTQAMSYLAGLDKGKAGS